MENIMIQVSVAIIAVGFIFLVYFIVQTLKVLKAALEEMRTTIGQLRTDVTKVSDEVQDVMQNVNVMALDVRAKLSALDNLFHAVDDIGYAVNSLTSAAKQTAASMVAARRINRKSIRKDNSGEKDNHMMKAMIEGVSSAVRIWKIIKQK